MKKDIVKVTLPTGISVNHAYFYKNGRRIKTKTARDYEDKVIQITLPIVHRYGAFEEKRKIICELTFYFQDNIRRDTHNQFKLMFDAIEHGGLYKDDRYVLPRVLDWKIDKANPRVELTFYYMEEANQK